ncbi:MAG: MFS transporter [Gammaproteobacteria bacterium]|nr:MFS transporter [Gammaproteobacteria bacterium]
MDKYTRAAVIYAAIVTIGGFIFGIDAAVISGTIKYITVEFALDEFQIGNVVAAPGLGVLFALIATGAICEAIGRKKTLIIIAFLYIISAVASAFAPTYETLVLARFLGGLAFTSLSLSSMYIGEIAPSEQRGKLVSTNQIMIVVGLTAAYFSNYFLVQAVDAQASWVKAWNLEENLWRWMLGMEIVPAVIWGILLFFIPQSPRWLMSKGREVQARQTLAKLMPVDKIDAEIEAIKESIEKDRPAEGDGIIPQVKSLTNPKFRAAIFVGLLFAAIQPLTGVNPILFYAPMVFEQTGIGSNAAYAQSLIIGVVSFLFTAAAIALVDKLGRRPLVNGGLIASVVCLMMCVFAFKQATYQLDKTDVMALVATSSELTPLNSIVDQQFGSDTDFKDAVKSAIGDEVFRANESPIIQAAVSINATLVLIGIVGFIAAFHISIGPIMWVIFSEIVPTQIRGVAIPMFAFTCSIVSYFMQKFFPWQLKTMGAGDIFLSYALAGLIGLYFLYRYLPETKNKTIEEVEELFAAKQTSNTK